MDKGGEIDILDDGTWVYKDWDGNVIKYTDGYPDFKEAGFVRNEVTLEDGFTTRSKDFREADKISPKKPDGTWHYHQDGKTLQDVPTLVRRRFTHKGGFALKKK
ncbi:HNH endonuclease [Enterococcus caccae]|uniref:Cytoplasmic protein n=1 Tax=Enterococcus caccae ATCC BAA-1240 TaxID=1158612 RepID=R3WAY1_9ENTE|nr:HNH endonuclease [Enterococcus caccae]EOL45081.1 hypothetical protein UC7_01887 [Enterococcus caccae ATCC BAA-1240]EOT58488.1 hypothetical protein I580_02659 [Enterococcus caccae ATCC BAA-1240]